MCINIFFVGYLLTQVPSNPFLGKPAVYLPTAMVIWGIISTSTVACQSFRGLVVIRFMLGFVEVAYSVSLHTSITLCWRGKELGLHTVMLYSGNLLSGIFSGLISRYHRLLYGRRKSLALALHHRRERHYRVLISHT